MAAAIHTSNSSLIAATTTQSSTLGEFMKSACNDLKHVHLHGSATGTSCRQNLPLQHDLW